jgi:hypothetical protein
VQPPPPGPIRVSHGAKLLAALEADAEDEPTGALFLCRVTLTLSLVASLSAALTPALLPFLPPSLALNLPFFHQTSPLAVSLR